MLVTLLISIVAAETYFPSPTIYWPAVEDEPTWPTETADWILPSEHTRTPTQPRDDSNTARVITIVASSTAAVAVVAVGGFFIYKRRARGKAMSPINPEPLVASP